MNVQFKKSFAKDLRSIRNQSVLDRVKETVEQVEQAASTKDIANLKKLQGGGNYYRIRIGEFRVGVAIESESVTFIRCLNRKEIYKFFP